MKCRSITHDTKTEWKPEMMQKYYKYFPKPIRGNPYQNISKSAHAFRMCLAVWIALMKTLAHTHKKDWSMFHEITQLPLLPSLKQHNRKFQTLIPVFPLSCSHFFIRKWLLRKWYSSIDMSLTLCCYITTYSIHTRNAINVNIFLNLLLLKKSVHKTSFYSNLTKNVQLKLYKSCIFRVILRKWAGIPTLMHRWSFIWSNPNEASISLLLEILNILFCYSIVR